ncbi:hypothetical protein ACNUDN_11775 [Mycobacterium sp. smrl_JER01]|uniref:hypothetical protein n=1 Tax=Mycobacterium sp. smrl_JER01 TaxID=3402633 RepID=UPI003AC45835
MTGLFSAVAVLDDARRSANSSTKGRMSKVEVDVLRSAIVFTSAGLDAAMKRLVNDVGRFLAQQPGTGARGQFEQYIREQLARPQVTESFRAAVLSIDVSEQMLSTYLGEKTKASFQGSSDLRTRVRETLGIRKTDVPNDDLTALDDFFLARNKISHEMDLKAPDTDSTARVHRNPDAVAAQCAEVFRVGTALICGAAIVCRNIGPTK